jgi:hypothetical protein
MLSHEVNVLCARSHAAEVDAACPIDRTCAARVDVPEDPAARHRRSDHRGGPLLPYVIEAT